RSSSALHSDGIIGRHRCFDRGQEAQLCEPTEAACSHLREINTEIAQGPCKRVEPPEIQQSPIEPSHSMTSSARARIDGGTVGPSAVAVFKLMTSSNLVGCSIGRSAGSTPLRIFPT